MREILPKMRDIFPVIEIQCGKRYGDVIYSVVFDNKRQGCIEILYSVLFIKNSRKAAKSPRLADSVKFVQKNTFQFTKCISVIKLLHFRPLRLCVSASLRDELFILYLNKPKIILNFKSQSLVT